MVTSLDGLATSSSEGATGDVPPGVARMTAAEKAAFATGQDFWSTRSAPELGLPAVRLGDGPHGLRVQPDESDELGLNRSLPSTCFPPAVTLASSWDVDLIREVAAALGREARALGVNVVLGPGLNLKRSPLCGRNFEYYSEDPFLSGSLASAAVEGLQSQGVGACPKHFAANNQETDRFRISADIDERTLREMYLRGFQIVVERSAPWMVMSSYNRINGEYTDQSHRLITEILKQEWGFDGIVVSDWGAVYDPVGAFQAGVDLRMPGRPDDPRVREAAAAGEISEARIADFIGRLARLAGRVDHSPFDVDYEENHSLTRRAAAESAVLLKNCDASLPLSASLRRIAVVGEFARTPRYQGAGSSAVNPKRLVTALDALRARVGDGVEVDFAPGFELTSVEPDESQVAEAVAASAAADVTLVFLGLPPSAEAEGSDRTTIDLPPNQIHLVDAVAQSAKGPVIVVLSNGSAVTTAPWRDHASAIVEFWLTGQAQGDAIMDVLFGDVNPSGKLAETIPVRIQDTPAFLGGSGEFGHVLYGEGIFVGYRYYDARDIAVDYPFGHGLSYTDFAYSDLVLSPHGTDDPVAITVEATITNVGNRAGAEVVQVYVNDLAGVFITPPQELRAFGKVHLEAGDSERVTLDIPRDQLQHYHPEAGWTSTGGRLEVRVGSSSRDIRLKGTVELEKKEIATPLSAWSTLDEWYSHPDVAPRLHALIDERGGIKGRAADLLSDPIGSKSILSTPMQGLMQFPGFPIGPSDVSDLLGTDSAAFQ